MVDITSEKRDIPLEEAKAIAKEIVDFLTPNSEKVEIVGSIRRGKPVVHDVDLIILPKNSLMMGAVFRYIPNAKIKKQGDKLVSLLYKSVQVDCYLANHSTYEVVRLIRTGSTESNIRLCSEAKKRGWRMQIGGNGLYDEKGELISGTEEGILMAVFGKNIPPEERV